MCKLRVFRRLSVGFGGFEFRVFRCSSLGLLGV